MGSDSEEEFDAWVAFVQESIDEATGFEVAVEAAGAKAIQNDTIKAGDAEKQQIVKEALEGLWESFCSQL